LELLKGTPSVLLDAAHNPNGAEGLAAFLRTRAPEKRVLLFGAMADKDWRAMLQTLAQVVDAFVFVAPEMKRAERPERFEPIAAEPRFASIARALSRRNRRDADVVDVRAVLHVEHASSLVMVLRGDRIAFCREVPTGGHVLDRAVAARLSVPIESASQLRAQRIAAARGHGEPVDPVTEEAALAATRATLDSLAGEVALCLRYFGVTFRGGQPADPVERAAELEGPGALQRLRLDQKTTAEPRVEQGRFEQRGKRRVPGDEARLPLVIAAAANLSMNENRPVTIAEMEQRLAKA
jgi:hypothetical protein